MATADITIRVQDMRAFKIAVEALRVIAAAEPDTDDPDTRERSYGTCAEIAQTAIDEIVASV